jgi:tetratricopeptide (TPR) repeat protein
MYTTNGEKQAVRALHVFEQAHDFFQQDSSNIEMADGKVRIFAFKSEQEYRPYGVGSGAFAYYLQSRKRDYIVMQDIDTRHYEPAIHEYTHRMMRLAKMKLPIWLNEGLAELYSSLEVYQQKARIGRPPVGRMATLAQQKWMDWDALFQVGYDSPYYNENEKMSIFYAQSWALTDMLALRPDYAPEFPQFLAAIKQGMTSVDALGKVYGKTPVDVGAEVSRYVSQIPESSGVIEVPMRHSAFEARAEELTEFEIEFALAELLASRKDTTAEAERRLLMLAEQNPDNAEVEESLGYLAWQRSDLAGARAHFSKSVGLDSKNSQMIYDLARLEYGASAGLDTVIRLLKKVVELESTNIGARLLLAQLDASQGRYGPALSEISTISSVLPSQAFRFFSVQAYVRANLKDMKGAKESAQQAAPYAQTQEERQYIERLLRVVNKEAPVSTANGDSEEAGDTVLSSSS